MDLLKLCIECKFSAIICGGFICSRLPSSIDLVDGKTITHFLHCKNERLPANKFILSIQKEPETCTDKGYYWEARTIEPAENKEEKWPIYGVRVDGDSVIIKVIGGNAAARKLCGELVELISPAVKNNGV